MASDNWKNREDTGSTTSVRVPTAANLSPYSLDTSYLPPVPEFVFPVEVRRRSWNEMWFDRVGTCYMTGLASGCVWGLYDGLRHPEGRTTRLRMNSVLNGLTRRGPFMANTLAALAVMYSPMETAIGRYRGVEDSANSVAAATITGVIYKSTAGVRAMCVAGAAGCALIGVYTVGQYLLSNNGGSLLRRNYT